MTTQVEARRYLVALLPPGAEELYDLDPGGDVFNLLDAAATLIRVAGFDLLDKLRVELFPGQSVDKLPDWEAFLGLARFFIARFGTLAQRQQSVVSKIREKGAFNDPNVQSIVGPLLGYAATSTVEVLHANRSYLRLIHTYSTTALLTIADSATVREKQRVLDGGLVSGAGARLVLEFGGAGPYTFDITLRAPAGGTAKTWSLSAVDGTRLKALFAVEMARTPITGNWVIEVTNHSGAPLTLMWSLFVEGIAQDQETGGAVAHWGIFADPAHVGEQGFSDFEAVVAAIARIKHADSVGRIITSKEPWPGETSGAHQSIPGRCIPSPAT